MNNPDVPIKLYQTGYRQRVEYVYAVVTLHNIQRKGSEPNNHARQFARSMGNSNDDAGHIIANRLGGTGQENYNIFPQSPNINRGVWKVIEAGIHNQVLTSGQPVEVIVQLYYQTPTSTRPSHFTYRAAFGGLCHTADVINP